ncbi:hypothetical protein PFICI_11481 [Pestalotiopsis fici W106-1]|uniref:Uncharacterized protein n=1 Tax=Pestalotiopsis fici (strain W106-1 / CGMCC3.15140) TaxID=1229662 RepID=W3WQK9_PESFW|nr:uncharacterized protein PFICI_11481 [Pestalotiopsis fici W106-1]ETS76094.1 hypothetical protein PFICI_11481 [Pestalotiopsis fici W106-1]
MADNPMHVFGDSIGSWVQNEGTSAILHNVTQLTELGIQSSLVAQFPHLTEVDELILEGSFANFGGDDFSPVLPNLVQVNGDAIFKRKFSPIKVGDLEVGGNLTIQDNGAGNWDTASVGGSSDGSLSEDYSTYEWNIHHVEGHFIVSNVSNVAISMPNLTNVNAQLTIENCVNSTFSFASTTSIPVLLMQNNPGSLLPGNFRTLQFADTVVLNGNIDMSSNGNIFPSLRLVQGQVTIEAWNADFNCSKLVQQQRDGLIGHLTCNGTDSGNSTTTTSVQPVPSDQGSSLSLGAWVGIGVGIGVLALALIFSFSWTLSHRRRRNMERKINMNAEAAPSPDVVMAHNGHDLPPRILEFEGDTSFRPAEMDGRRSPVEMDATPRPVEKPA